jgi:hypothetical protein
LKSLLEKLGKTVGDFYAGKGAESLGPAGRGNGWSDLGRELNALASVIVNRKIV